MKPAIKALLLKSGMLAVVIYLLHILLGGFLWKEYSHVQQPISDLTATGAPNKQLMMLLTGIYGILALVFAISFTFMKGKVLHRLVYWGGFFFILLHIFSISYGFFPQDLPGSEPTFKGTMHLVVTALIVPFTIFTPLLIGLGLKKNQEHRLLGKFSIVCGLLMILFGGLSGLFYAKHLSYFGLVERLNIGTLQIWMFILSYKVSR